jgi:ATP-dependent DNA helicase RecG
MDLELRREGDVLGALQSGRRSGLRLLSLLRHEEVIARARGYATDVVAADPGLAHHPGLRALVAETVGDDERAAYLDKV